MTQGLEITNEEAWEEWQAQALGVVEEALHRCGTQPITITPVLNAQGRAVAWDYIALGTLDPLLTGRIGAAAGKVLPSNNPQFLWVTRG